MQRPERLIKRNCDICGGEGIGDAYKILYNTPVHRDPKVCREILAKKAKELQLRDDEISDKERQSN